RDLAYRKEAAVNWCPHDRTVLANEQVIAGRCERCGTIVERKALTQWFFRITAYAQRLLDDMDQLAGRWPEAVLTLQRHWLGRSAGAYIEFEPTGAGPRTSLSAPRRGDPHRAPQIIRVFTTKPETLPGVTFLAVAADSPLADDLCSPDQREQFEAYRAAT